MQQGLLAGKLDVIVTVPCGAGDAIRWIPLRECGWQLAMHARHPLAVERSIPVAALADAKLLLYDREHYPDYWQRVTAFFRDAKVQAKIAGEFDGITSLAAAIEANLGVAILADTTRVDPGRMVTRPMDVQPEPIPVAAGIPAGHPSGPHILEFIEELKQPLPLGS
jgi:DNA-binding transcriptional LysR family regulator